MLLIIVEPHLLVLLWFGRPCSWAIWSKKEIIRWNTAAVQSWIIQFMLSTITLVKEGWEKLRHVKELLEQVEGKAKILQVNSSEGDIGVYSIVVLDNFSCNIFILNCGIAVFPNLQGAVFSSFDRKKKYPPIPPTFSEPFPVCDWFNPPCELLLVYETWTVLINQQFQQFSNQLLQVTAMRGQFKSN